MSYITAKKAVETIQENYNKTKKESEKYDMDILKLYTCNKTDTRTFFNKEINKNLKEIIKDIQRAKIPNDLKPRTNTKLGYIYKRNSINEILTRKFIEPTKPRFSAEHAQKFYLYQYSSNQKCRIEPFGYIVTYELPFFEERKGGAIDLVAYDEKKNILHLIEMKNCEMGTKKDSNESLIRAILEIETYAKFVEYIKEKEENKKGQEGRLLKEIREKLNNEYGLNILEDTINKCKIQKDLLIPETLYKNSMTKNKEEAQILVELPEDINIYILKLKDKQFNTSQKIVDTAKNKEMIFDIKLVNEK